MVFVPRYQKDTNKSAFAISPVQQEEDVEKWSVKFHILFDSDSLILHVYLMYGHCPWY